MTGFIISIIVTAISLLIISKIRPIGVEIDSPVKALLGGAIIGIFSGIGSLLPGGLQLFIAVLSFGLVPLLSGMIIFGLAAWIVDGFELRYKFWSALLGAIALAIINSVLFFILGLFGIG